MTVYNILCFSRGIAEATHDFGWSYSKNNPDIPVSFMPSRDRQVFSSEFGFTKTSTLVSYAPKKAVIVLSSYHLEIKVKDDAASNTPLIILTYHETKAGIDTLDQLVAKYNVK